MAFPIHTTRLLLRNVIPDDFEAMVAAWTAPDVAGFMDDFGPRTRDEVEEWLPKAIEARKVDPTSYGCSIVTKETGDVIGWIGFGPSRRGVADIDFAYVIEPRSRGRGYATEALRGVIDFCFADLGVSSVWGECHVDNTASARVMENAGMEAIGEVDGQQRFIARRT